MSEPVSERPPVATVNDTFGRPLRSLRLSVTDRCNLRCKYCMPEEEYAWLPRETVLAELGRLDPLVDKTGGPTEREAMAYIRAHVARAGA